MIDPVNAIDWLDIAEFGKCDELGCPLIQVDSARQAGMKKAGTPCRKYRLSS
jgi:hypothetical protein